MGDEAFDSFNAPQFVDFSQRPDILDDSVDAYFDSEYRNQSRFEKIELFKNRKQSSDDYFSLDDILDSENEPDPMQVLHEQSERQYHLRKSMSVGNLVMFSEVENRNYHENPTLLCEDFREISISVGDKVKSNGRENIQRKQEMSPRARSLASSRQSIFSRKGSQDHLNKLAQPKHYTSVESLGAGNITKKYVSMAEAINQFQNRTPVRFRSRPTLLQEPPQVSQPLTKTVPESPALQTKARSRPTQHILSREEKERIEFENMQKFKIKANPVNKKILQGPVKLAVLVDKKPATKPVPFNLTSMPPKKTAPSPVKYEFHARPRPKCTKMTQRAQVQRRELTKPVTPTFMKNYRPPSYRTIEQKNDDKGDQMKNIHPGQKSLTKPKPFSFEQRDKMVQEKREQMIQKIREEERRAREFHARPLPKSFYRNGDSVKSASNSSLGSSGKSCTSTQNISTEFKARPPLVLYKEPFIPAKSDKPLTSIEPFVLASELRQPERDEFERQKRIKEEKRENLRRLMEERRMQEEQEEIERIRKEAEYKAQPIKKYKELVIQPSNKVTQPISPKFQSNLIRQQKNKENIPALVADM